MSDVRNCRGATRQQNQELIVGSCLSGPSTKKNTVLRVVLGLTSSRGALAAGRTAPRPSLLLCVLYLSSTHNEGPPTVDAAAGWKWKKLGPVATHSFSGGTPLEHSVSHGVLPLHEHHAGATNAFSAISSNPSEAKKL